MKTEGIVTWRVVKCSTRNKEKKDDYLAGCLEEMAAEIGFALLEKNLLKIRIDTDDDERYLKIQMRVDAVVPEINENRSETV